MVAGGCGVLADFFVLLHPVDSVLDGIEGLGLPVEHLVELAGSLVFRRLEPRFEGGVEYLQLVL